MWFPRGMHVFISLTPKSAKLKKISFCKMLKNKRYQAKLLPKRFHLNCHTTGIRGQTQKLEVRQKTWNVALLFFHLALVPFKAIF